MAAAAAILLLLAAQAEPAAGAQKAAVFDFEFIDTSLEGEMQGARADEQARIERVGRQLRDALAASGRYALVDLAPAEHDIAAAGQLHACRACVAKIARSLGAEVAVTGTVQKVSNLILNINLVLWDAATGEAIQAMSADIRGNTDESWSRGLSYLLRNRLLAAPAPAPAD